MQILQTADISSVELETPQDQEIGQGVDLHLVHVGVTQTHQRKRWTLQLSITTPISVSAGQAREQQLS